MQNANKLLVTTAIVLVAQGCSLQKWDKLNEGNAGSSSESGGTAGNEAEGGKATKGGNSAKGGAKSNGGTTAVDGTHASVGSTANKGGAAGEASSTAITSVTGGTSVTSGGTSSLVGSGGTNSTSNGGTVAVGGSTAIGGNTATGGASTVTCDPSKPFGPWMQIVPSTGTSSENGISVSADGLSAIVTSRADSTSDYDLKIFNRTSTSFSFVNSTSLLGAANVNTTSSEVNPRLSRDGLTLIFAKWTLNSTLYRSTRTSTSFEFPAPTVLSMTINGVSSANDDPWISSDNTEFYWTANAKIYRADVSNGFVFSNANSVPELNVISAASAPVVTEDQLTMYLSSTQVASSGVPTNNRIWTAKRANRIATWATPSLVTELADGSAAYPSDVSTDGCIIYFKKAYAASNFHLFQAVKPL